jgi:hypothetical protein
MVDDVVVHPDPQQPPRGSPPEDIPDGEITDDPTVAWEEGEVYQPPIDPPIAGTEGDDPRIAAGFGQDEATDPPTEDSHRSLELADDEVSERVREALLADSLGSLYVDDLDIESAGGIVRLEGVVEDLDIQDHLLGVVESVSGVTEVRDRLRLPDEPVAGVPDDRGD